jgi:hypothetical protein
MACWTSNASVRARALSAGDAARFQRVTRRAFSE